MKLTVVLALILITGIAFAFYVAGAWPYRQPLNDSPAKSTFHRHSPSSTTSPKVIRGVGYVEPVSEVRKLTFKIDGVIDKCHVEIGQLVEVGELLVTLRNQDEQAAVGVAEEQLIVARAERDKLFSGAHPRQIESAERRVAKDEEKVRYAQRFLDRISKMREKGASSLEDHDRAATELRQVQEELNASSADLKSLQTQVRDEDKILAESRVRLAEAHLTVAKERLRNTQLNSPIRGSVLEILKREGEAVRFFDVQPTLICADISHLRVRAEIDERYVGSVCVGQQATIYSRSLGDRQIPGKVILVKSLMGNKTVFSRDAAERKDLEVLQLFIESTERFDAPVGLRVDVALMQSP